MEHNGYETLVPVSPNPEESLFPQALAAACLCPVANTTDLPTTMEGSCVWRVYKRMRWWCCKQEEEGARNLGCSEHTLGDPTQDPRLCHHVLCRLQRSLSLSPAQSGAVCSAFHGADSGLAGKTREGVAGFPG